MDQRAKHYFMYVLLCADQSLYCGFTDDVWRRFKTHQAKKGAKYTKVSSRHPLQLIYYAEYATKREALQAEARFKRLTRPQKEDYLQKHGVKLFHKLG